MPVKPNPQSVTTTLPLQRRFHSPLCKVSMAELQETMAVYLRSLGIIIISMTIQPVLIPSSPDTDVLSRPLASYPDAQAILWREAETHKVLMYQQFKAVLVRIR